MSHINEFYLNMKDIFKRPEMRISLGYSVDGKDLDLEAVVLYDRSGEPVVHHINGYEMTPDGPKFLYKEELIRLCDFNKLEQTVLSMVNRFQLED